MNGDTDPCYSGSTCTSGVCKVDKETVGESCCTGTEQTSCSVKMCDIGQYCVPLATEGDTAGKCAAVMTGDTVCTQDYECGYGAFCDLYTNPEAAKCAMDGTLANGVKTNTVNLDGYCASGNSVNIGTTEAPDYACMKASETITDNTNSVASGSKCEFNEYTDQANPGTATKGEADAVCGFNLDD